jgi:hypothetical protein
VAWLWWCFESFDARKHTHALTLLLRSLFALCSDVHHTMCQIINSDGGEHLLVAAVGRSSDCSGYAWSGPPHRLATRTPDSHSMAHCQITQVTARGPLPSHRQAS